MTARTPAIALLALLLLVTAVAAAPLVQNPAQSKAGVTTVTPAEVWRAGGEDDDVFFGSVGRVLGGSDGQVLVLDTQQTQVQVYDRNGEWLHTLGREGDGPGEARRCSDAFLLSDGRLSLMQQVPGRMVYINPDATPAGEGRYHTAGEAPGFVVLVSGRTLPGGSLVAGIRIRQQGPVAEQTFFLARCNAEGEEQAVFLEKVNTVNYADFRLDELSGDFPWVSRMDTDAQGQVYTAPERNQYLIRVQDPTGAVVREFTRPAALSQRTDDETTIARKIQEGIGANYGIPLQGVTVEDTEPMVAGLWVQDSGEVWVQTPANELPDGAFALLDVFAADGTFARQVALHVPGDPQRDGLYMLPDGRVVVVHGGLDAWLSQQGIEASTDDAPVLEVVVYEAI